jgi:hypothetical protein
LALDDHLAQFVVQMQQLGNRGAPAITAAPAMAAALAVNEVVVIDFLRIEARGAQFFIARIDRRTATGAHQPDQALGEQSR